MANRKLKIMCPNCCKESLYDVDESVIALFDDSPLLEAYREDEGTYKIAAQCYEDGFMRGKEWATREIMKMANDMMFEQNRLAEPNEMLLGLDRIKKSCEKVLKEK